MEIAGVSVPLAVLLLATVALAGMAVALVDLARHDVRHLPKWAWAAVVVLVSFPIGAVAYFVVGRVSAAEGAPTGLAPALPAPPPAGRVPARRRVRSTPRTSWSRPGA